MRNALLILSVALCGATCLNAPAQIKAQGYDTPSYVQFSAPRYEVSETETNAVVTIVRSGDSRKIASVDYSTREGTAADGVDFESCGGTIVFSPGQNFRTITIPIHRESDPVVKTFHVEMTEADVNTTVTTPSAEVQINPLPPALEISAKKGDLVLSWRDGGGPFVLEAQVNGQWSAVAATPALADGVWSVGLKPGAPVVLFRLRLDSQSAE